MTGIKQSFQFIQYERESFEQKTHEVIVESPVSLSVNGEFWLTLLCTPIDLENLAIGFLYNEGIIRSIEDIASVYVCPTEENIDIWLSHQVKKPEKWLRTSGCTGGKTSVEFDLLASKTILSDTVPVSSQQVNELIEILVKSQDLYRKTGGVHTSALSDGYKLLATAEDIGRHNTLDKIAGHILQERIRTSGSILLTTGRISSEMLQKARQIGTEVVISRTSPSSLSIKLAERWGITLIGYARRSSFRIYTHPERITSTLFS